MAPGAFLVANILLVFSVQAMAGIKPSEFPVQLPWIADFPLTLLRYLLGVVVISGCIVWVLSPGEFPRGITKVAPTVCYASVVYLPLTLVDMQLSDSGLRVLLNFMSWVFDRRPFAITTFSSVMLIVTLALYGVGVMWWARLIHLGLRSVQLERPYARPIRTLLRVFTKFLVLKWSLIFLLGIVAAWGVFVAWFQGERLKVELRENPPKCAVMWGLAQEILTEKNAPTYPQYLANMVIAACTPSIFFPSEVDTRRIESVIASIRESKFKVAKTVLEKYLDHFGKGKTDAHNPVRNVALQHLKEAERLSNSPMFWEASNCCAFTFPPSPIALFP
jgi:hypothetical protein